MKKLLIVFLFLGFVALATLAFAQPGSQEQESAKAGNGNNGCKDLPDYNALKAALVAATAAETSGLNDQMWGHNRRSRWRGVCGGVFRSESRSTMAGQSGYLCTESQHRQCFRSRLILL